MKQTSLLRSSCYVGGKWIASAKTFPVNNPATGKLIAKVPSFAGKETKQAIDAASHALPLWAGLTAKERSTLLKEWHKLIMLHADEIASILTSEQGKPLAEAKGEVIYAASFIEWFAEEAKRAYGEIIPAPANTQRILILRQPVGVVAAITPWNFPAAMVTRKVAPALAAGCTVLLKPAEDTPLTALALAALAERAGIPAGVFNVITGAPEPIAKVMMESSIVKKISFTGSTEVGKLLYKASAETIKKISLELGGNAPFIVFDDADIEQAVSGLMHTKFRNAGQTCISANRVLVQADIAPKFVRLLSDKIRKLKLGNGTDKGVDVGPLINKTGLDKVERLLKDAAQKKAKIVLGGKAKKDCFFEPTLVTGITPQMKIWQEEIFGPVLAVSTFKTEQEAIKLANATPYGLAAYFYSEDYKRQWRVAEALDYGMVGVNASRLSNEVAPFGGMKESGIGREGSRHGLEEYLEIKYVCIDGVK